MKKIFIFILLLFPLLFAACGKNEDKVVSIAISDNFYEETFYQGDDIDEASYIITITYESGKIDECLLSECYSKQISTSTAGINKIFINIDGFTKEISYTVEEVVVLNATYNGESLTFYKGETPNFGTNTFSVLYSNGNEEIKNLSLATYQGIDYTLDGGVKDLIFVFGGVNFTVKYSVTHRPLSEDVYYNINDKAGLYSFGYQIKFSGGKFYVYDMSGVAPVQKDSFQAESVGYNKYRIRKSVGGKLTYVYYYLVNNTIQVEV